LGVVPSHELIEVDEDGDPITETARMTYVDEATCVGCTLCAGIAPSTFQMTDDHGRARVFNQEGEDEETITEAISTCPVSCIHFVPWDELVSLEKERDEMMTQYNFKSRLVGNDGFLYAEGGGQSQDISTNSMLRCNNCPSNECEDCPMFGVGDRVNGKACGNCPTNGCPGCPLLCGNQISGDPLVVASARWRGVSRPSTQRCPRDRVGSMAWRLTKVHAICIRIT
jgi:ferredoxin